MAQVAPGYVPPLRPRTAPPQTHGRRKRLARDAVWKPQGKAQTAALASTMVGEVLMEGERGGGKTITLIMCFVSQVGRGWGANWRGVIFRQTHPALKDIIKQSKQWIPLIYPDAKFTHNDSTWTFAGGEQLTFSHFATPDDYWSWHGQEIPFIGWEELTSWFTSECYTMMLSCSRSSAPPNPVTGEKMPRIVRSTTNPYGPGRLWVKERWLLPDMRNKIRTGIKDEANDDLKSRLAIHFKLEANKILMENDPEYRSSIRAAAAGNEAMRAAWLEGDWDISVGGMFDDLWDRAIHVVEPFYIPRSWRLERAFDYGFSKPYSIGIYAISDGTPYRDAQGNLNPSVNGDVYRVAELYGWNGKANHGCEETSGQIAEKLKELEELHRIHGYVQPGPADLNIFARDRGPTMHEDFLKLGVGFKKATKDPGSRKRGWQIIRERLRAALPRYRNPDGRIVSYKRKSLIDAEAVLLPREEKAIFFFGDDRNFHMLRTLVGAPRDDTDMDDVDTDYEDHALDELRYEIGTKKVIITQGNY